MLTTMKDRMRGAAILATCALVVQTTPIAAAVAPQNSSDTRTPIKHVIVIIGENRSFDHVFATYKPPKGQTVSNLLSKGIINEDGTPGPNYAAAKQYQAVDSLLDGFTISPSHNKSAYNHLPAVNTGGAPTEPYFSSEQTAKSIEPALPDDYYKYLTTGGSGLPAHAVDTRIANVGSLPSGPYPLTNAKLPYDSYTGSPVHRFYEMWQQSDCNVSYATKSNPSGCRNDLFPWVEVTVGAGSNGLPRPTPFTNQTTGEGSISMGFYNVAKGDAPYLTYLARTYTLSDNFHQAVMGGTGANHVALGSGDAIWYSDEKGNPAQPPADEIENPNAQAYTNNYYAQDGYSGGTYSDCANLSAPGVKPVVSYLSSLPYRPSSKCEPKHFYLLNNYSPGYFADGWVNTGQFVIPPSKLRMVGDELSEHSIGWKYYGEGWNIYKTDPHYTNPANLYCDICNFAQYTSSVMTNPTKRANHIADVTDLYSDIDASQLPALSFVKPDELLDGHPASSKLNLFEGFVKKIIDKVQANPKVWASTAIIVTFDEAGGYWDSGYIQPLDFFGDGPRIPTIVVSPYSKGGRVVHTYYDHVSILKFIETNWKLKPLTARSRDNLPNPVVGGDPYVPTNAPAIGNMLNMFRF